MRIEQLQYLVDIKATKSINKTASNFYISQQGISDSLKKLEQELQVTLLDKNRHGTFLTPFGESFVEYAAQIVDLHTALMNMVETHKNTQLLNFESTLTIMVHPRIYRNIISDILIVFHKHCPKVKIRVLEKLNEEIFANVCSNSIDLGFICATNKDIEEEELFLKKVINHEILLKDDVVVCAKADSKFAMQKSYLFSQMNNLPVINYDFALAAEKHISLSEENPFFLATNDMELHRKFLESGLAVDVMTKFEYDRHYKNNPIFSAIPVKNEQLNFVLIRNEHQKQNLAISYFISLLQAYNFNN